MITASVVLLAISVIIFGYYLWQFIALNSQVNSVEFIYVARNPADAIALMREFNGARNGFFIMLVVVIVSAGLIFLANFAEKKLLPKLREKKEETSRMRFEAEASAFVPEEKTVTERKAMIAEDVFGAPASVEEAWHMPGDLEETGPKEELKPTFCPNCGTKLPDIATFCGKCGTKRK